jgi:hypothetical protein
MTAILSEFAFSQFSLLAALMMLIFLAAVIVIAIYRKDRVKAAIFVRSFGFFLEASNDREAQK